MDGCRHYSRSQVLQLLSHMTGAHGGKVRAGAAAAVVMFQNVCVSVCVCGIGMTT